MSYTNDWSDTVPIDHTKFKNAPGAIRTLRIDIEQRLTNLFYGWAAGEVQADEGVKNLPFRWQAADPGATTNKIKLYSKQVSSKSELFAQDEDGNILQITKAGKLNSLALDVSLAGLAPLLNVIFYVGFILQELTNVNPATTYGIGTWVAWGSGRVPTGVDTGQTEFNTVEKTGGAKTVDSSHTHTGVTDVANPGTSSGSYVLGDSLPHSDWKLVTHNFTTASGGPATLSILQPYITCYFWKRTA